MWCNSDFTGGWCCNQCCFLEKYSNNSSCLMQCLRSFMSSLRWHCLSITLHFSISSSYIPTISCLKWHKAFFMLFLHILFCLSIGQSPFHNRKAKTIRSSNFIRSFLLTLACATWLFDLPSSFSLLLQVTAMLEGVNPTWCSEITKWC